MSKRYSVVLVPLLINGIVDASHNLGEEVFGKRQEHHLDLRVYG
jgi:hypothetical protein